MSQPRVVTYGGPARSEKVLTTNVRLAGYHEALQEADAHADLDPVLLGDWSVQRATAVLGRLLGQGPQDDASTAVCCSSARSSTGVVLALQALGRSDITLVSFGGLPAGRGTAPADDRHGPGPLALGPARGRATVRAAGPSRHPAGSHRGAAIATGARESGEQRPRSRADPARRPIARSLDPVTSTHTRPAAHPTAPPAD